MYKNASCIAYITMFRRTLIVIFDVYDWSEAQPIKYARQDREEDSAVKTTKWKVIESSNPATGPIKKQSGMLYGTEILCRVG